MEMRALPFRIPGFGVALVMVVMLLFFQSLHAAESVPVERLVTGMVLRGPVNPGSARYFSRVLDEASLEGSGAVLVELDTPGGLVSSLRTMVKAVMASPVPVIVYVSPSGAEAASAGALLLLSAHVAAMSPGTETGAAHPVTPGIPGQGESAAGTKAVNDLAAFARSLALERGRNPEWAERAVRESLASSASEALQEGVIDIIADTPKELLRRTDGRQLKTAAGIQTLSTAGARLVMKPPSFSESVLMAVAHPDIAYILFLAGLLGLYFEFASPGAIFPGTAGAVALLLGLYSLQLLSASITGILLLMLAVLFLAMEVFVTSGGVLAVAGLVSLFAGSLMLFDFPSSGLTLSLQVFLPVFIAFSLAVVLILRLIVRSARGRKLSGGEGLVGETGEALEPLAPGVPGKVFVHGELWDAVSASAVEKGGGVRVEGMKGMQLQVNRQ
ncbi:Nodulation efficiency protein NfeD [Pelodictyon luteolum DSM 273]|uniref:Nodulation efficiency protein NfeD n=2 Tax=Pelodictyon luteolum TaxID=1100 RepID=Q3B3B5_CHLL3|nr:Nodulation efficiency protein NfeD [Pelodictyon luteolum DSM 273]